MPKKERRPRQVSEEEAYQDWRQRILAEPVRLAEAEVERVGGMMEAMLREWQESEGFWNGDVWPEEEAYRSLSREYQAAWGRWHERCMEWGEEAEETEVTEVTLHQAR